MPCPFAGLLGEPGKGVHAARILGIGSSTGYPEGLAQNDIIMTIIVAIITSYIYNVNFFISFLGWIILGEVLHYTFGVNTAGLRMLGIDVKCYS
jgi:hypothetical protein